MRHKLIPLLVIAAFILPLLSACDWNPLGLPRRLQIETTNELGSDTLARIDDLNETLDRGVEIGPETRATIEELNQTIREGVRLGFTEDLLARIDRLLAIAEQGIHIQLGLDPQTNATVNRMIDTINDAPGQWENTAVEIIETLEDSASAVAHDMAEEIRGLMVEARVNAQYITASMGTEFRCNVDFLGSRAGDTLDQFIGRTMVGQLRSIISGEPPTSPIPAPWICQIIPDQIDLVEVEGAYLYPMGVIKISGYNYIQANLPTAHLEDSAGQILSSEPLNPVLTSPYQVQVNLQGIDFSAIPPRSNLVFTWPTTGAFYKISILFPFEQPEPTEQPHASLTITAASVEVLKGPGPNYLLEGLAETGAEYLVLGKNSDGSWWQIDYDGVAAWVPDSAVQRNEIPTSVASLPLPPITADFYMDPASGHAPLEVRFTGSATGRPSRWIWDFGEGAPGSTQETVHTYTNPGTYTITMRVEDDFSFIEISKTITVDPTPQGWIAPIRPDWGFPLPVSTPPFPHGSFLFKTFQNLEYPPIYEDTGISAHDYDCGIVSMAATNGDIRESGTGNIIIANLTADAGNWYLHANFRTHKNEEEWYFVVMCLKKTTAEGYIHIPRVHLEPEQDTVNLNEYTGIEIPSTYQCGVVGFAAWTGDINEEGAQPYIIKTYTRWNASEEAWVLTADFITHYHHESWDVDVLCLYNNPSIFRFESYQQIQGGADYRTNFSNSDYVCSIWGMAALNGNIQENDTGDILKAYTYIGADGNWYIQANFRTQQGFNEFWNIDLICVHISAVMVDGIWLEGWVP